MKFINDINLNEKLACNFLLEIDRLKSCSNLSDIEILNLAYKNIINKMSVL
jgi:hypothetical protein